MSPRRFAFVVHALSSLHRRAIGLRRARPELVLGFDDGADAWSGRGRLATYRFGDDLVGDILAVPLAPEQMLTDQSRAVARMERVVREGMQRHGVRYEAVGLGSLCAVVGGRGDALAQRLSVPVTTGAAATAWSLWENTVAVAEGRQLVGPIGVVGSAGPVGRGVAALLADDGWPVRVDSKRGGRKLPVEVCPSVEDTVHGAPLIVGAGPTGGTLAPEAVASGAVLVDVAIPATLTGPPERGIDVLAGEAVVGPSHLRGGGWGPIYQTLAGYGPWQLFACVIEPLVMAATGRTEPYALGRRLKPDTIQAFGDAAASLGFRPRLARGFLEVDPRGRLTQRVVRRLRAR